MSLLFTADQHALFFRSRDDCSTAPKDRDVCLADISRVTCDTRHDFRLHAFFITPQKNENNLLLININTYRNHLS